MSDNPERPKTVGRCSMCGKPQTAQYRPFCSRRCADVDLHKWLTGRYAIPAVEDEERDDDAARE